MAAAGKSSEQIAAAVQAELRSTRHPRSGEPVFSPEFLARIRQIIVFRPLSAEAMEGICRKLIARRQAAWSAGRGKELVVADPLITHIARDGHQRNMRSRHQEGGRVIEKLITELIDDAIVAEVTRRPEEYRACRRVEVRFTPPDVRIAFAAPASEPARDEVRLALSDLRQIRSADPDGTLARAVSRLAALESAVGEASAEVDAVRAARLALEQHCERASAELARLTAEAITAATAAGLPAGSHESSPGTAG